MAKTNGLSKTTTITSDRSKKNLAGSIKPLSKSPVSSKGSGKSTGAHASPSVGLSDMKKRGSSK